MAETSLDARSSASAQNGDLDGVVADNLESSFSHGLLDSVLDRVLDRETLPVGSAILGLDRSGQNSLGEHDGFLEADGDDEERDALG